MKNKRSFTLIELLVVMGVLSVLLSITVIAINPYRLFKRAADNKRRSDVASLVNAVNQLASDNDGILPADITSTGKEIGKDSSGTKINLCPTLVPKYSASLPVSPEKKINPITDCTVDYTTGYGVLTTGANRVTVYSLTADLEPTISETR